MKKYRIPVIMLVLVMLFVLIPGGLADFGSFSGDSDFGGSSSWSSGSDWGSSSSWSSGSDWGSSSSWSSGSSWSSSPSYSTYSGYSGNSGSSSSGGSGGILFFVFLVFIIIVICSRRGTGSQHTQYNVPAGAQRTPQSKLTAMSGYTALDPAFNADALREHLSNLYVQMQNAWTNKDISSLRPYFTDSLFNQYARQAEMFKTAGRTNYVERIAVLGTDLRGYFQQDKYDHIIVEMRTRIVDYTVDDETGKLLSGSKTAEKFMTYEWDISRKTGVTTKAGGEVRTVNCPNCGAPLSINTTTVCPYCDSVVTIDQEDWAIVEIKGIAQYTSNK